MSPMLTADDLTEAGEYKIKGDAVIKDNNGKPTLWLTLEPTDVRTLDTNYVVIELPILQSVAMMKPGEIKEH